LDRWKPTEPAAPPSASDVADEYEFGAKDIELIPSGCTLLDCAIGGGWPIGRVCNIVGDRSTGKTLLAEEAMANFLLKYRNGHVWYRETEAAFDVSYAQALGLNTRRIDFGPEGPDTQWETMEALLTDVDNLLELRESAVVARSQEIFKQSHGKKFIDPATGEQRAYNMKEAERVAYKEAIPGLYIIDSLDGISSQAELKADPKKGTYGLDKQKLLSRFFRQYCRRLRRAKVCVMIISQTRANIGAAPWEKQYTRTGGKSLDFYASVIVYLSDMGKVMREVEKVKRAIGIHIKARCDKNKITVPHRECEFDIRFAYGIEDDGASLEWLKDIDKLAMAGFVDDKGKPKMPRDLEDVDSAKLKRDVKGIWDYIESKFLPAKGKYVE
jgi:recombination protein RecA